MNFIVKSKEIEISQDLNFYVEKRIGKLEKFLRGVDSDLIEADVEFEKAVGRQRQGEIFQLNVNLKFPGKFFRSEVTGDNLFAIVDNAEEELEAEIQKYKTKKETLFRRGARSIKKFYSLSPLARFREKK
jgi:putative sigma-54 modulation protein